jgi:YD repeat-containing protein
VTITNASSSKIVSIYNTQDNITVQIVTESSGNISTITNVYGTNDELSAVTNSTGTTSYQYDANVYVSQITGANGSIISHASRVGIAHESNPFGARDSVNLD